MRPVDKRFHSTIISRIKVMAELDIAEKRVHGRSLRSACAARRSTSMSIMPSVHGEDAVIRIDKESISDSSPARSTSSAGRKRRCAGSGAIREPRHGARHGADGSGKTTRGRAVESRRLKTRS
jgi:type II secretory ATPase GspE/PulE/Tfp pilus assembly ATPase PilB-like protein